VGMSQPDVDGISEGQPWACPGCWDNNRRRERAARRQQAKRGEQQGATGTGAGAPSSGSQQPISGGEGQGSGEGEKDGPRRGRPPKPFWQKVRGWRACFVG
jgi:hypothetical protein